MLRLAFLATLRRHHAGCRRSSDVAFSLNQYISAIPTPGLDTRAPHSVAWSSFLQPRKLFVYEIQSRGIIQRRSSCLLDACAVHDAKHSRIPRLGNGLPARHPSSVPNNSHEMPFQTRWLATRQSDAGMERRPFSRHPGREVALKLPKKGPHKLLDRLAHPPLTKRRSKPAAGQGGKDGRSANSRGRETERRGDENRAVALATKGRGRAEHSPAAPAANTAQASKVSKGFPTALVPATAAKRGVTPTAPGPLQVPSEQSPSVPSSLNPSPSPPASEFDEREWEERILAFSRDRSRAEWVLSKKAERQYAAEIRRLAAKCKLHR